VDGKLFVDRALGTKAIEYCHRLNRRQARAIVIDADGKNND
jgi:hypothetical protein